MIYNDINVDLATCQPATKGKRIVVMLIDFFLTFIFAYSLFAFVANPIYSNLPQTKEIINTYGEKEQKVTDIILNTGLQKKDENGERISLETSSYDFVKQLTRYSCFVHQIDYFELDHGDKNIIAPVENEMLYYVDKDGNYLNNALYQYYFNFQIENKDDYSKIEPYTIQDINEKLYDLDESNKNLIDSSFSLDKDSLVLSKENALKLLDYLNYQTASNLNLYHQVSSLYMNSMIQAVNEVENYYTPYIEAMNDFVETHNRFAQGICISMILSYISGFLISYLLFPLIFKRGKTIGFKFFNFAPTRADMMETRIINYLIKDIILFIEGICSIALMAIFMGKINLLSTPLIGPISLFQICMFSFFIIIISLVFFFISKDNQALSDYAAQVLIVDTRKREESFLIEQDRKEENNGKKSTK